MPRPTIHMVGNAHIDPVWLWVWQDGLEVAQQTCRNAIDIMGRHPDYIFSRSSAAVHEWIEKTDPALFREIKRCVEKGSWNIVNGWWVQPDCNIPCGESLIRQGLCGQHYFEERFGRMAKVGFNVDTFGHCGTLPQILSKCGLESYVFMRPDPREKTLPGDLFWWQSPDGSRVLACRLDGYGSSEVKDLDRKIQNHLARAKDTGIDTLCFYGRGDHGGGPMEDLVARVEELRREIKEAQITFSTPDDFFDSIRRLSPELPTVADDLQHHSRGCYTVVSEIKASNRRLETSLLNAERICAAAWLALGAEYPRDILRRCWQVLLFHQFHDVMGGTSIRPAYDDAAKAMATAMAESDAEREMAMEALSAKIRTIGQDGKQLLVFNPAPCARVDPIPFHEILPDDRDLVACDEEGSEYPVQVILSDDFEGRRSLDGVFLAPLPACGYRVFWLRQGRRGQTDLDSSETSVENEKLRIEIDPGTGFLCSVFDKDQGVEFLDRPSRPLVIRDDSDTWSHDVERFDDVIGAFSLEGKPVVEVGEARASIKVTSSYGRSRLIQTFTLYSRRPIVECELELDWHEEHKMLKLCFPVKISGPKASCEIPYGVIDRPARGQEEPCQRWVDVVGSGGEGKTRGLLLVNDSKYGFDVLDSEIRMSLIRSPIYAFHRPRKIEPGRKYLYTDQGKHRIRLGLVPHYGMPADRKFRLAERLNNPPVQAYSNPHDGPLPSTSSFITCQPRSVLVGAMKVAEKAGKLVIRLFESKGRPTDCAVKLPLSGLAFDAHLEPWEIKTILVDREGKALEADMLEREPD